MATDEAGQKAAEDCLSVLPPGKIAIAQLPLKDAGGLPSVMNALVDALSEYGIRHIDMPATPERVGARSKKPANTENANKCRNDTGS